MWFLVKVLVFMFGFVWLRGTLPRLRYDQLMDLGWKWLLPIALAWIVALGTVNVLRGEVSLLVLIGVIALMAVIAVVILGRVLVDEDDEPFAHGAVPSTSRILAMPFSAIAFAASTLDTCWYSS